MKERILSSFLTIITIIISALFLSGCAITINRPISMNDLETGIAKYGYSIPADSQTEKMPIKLGLELNSSLYHKQLVDVGNDVYIDILFPSGQIMKKAANRVFPLYFQKVERVKEWLPYSYDADLEISFKKFSYHIGSGFIEVPHKIEVTIGYKLYDKRGIWILSENITAQAKTKRAAGLSDDELAQMITEATLSALQKIALRVSFLLKNPRQAIKEAEKIVESYPENANAFVRLANAYLFAGRPDDAITAAKRGLQLQPGHSALLVTLGHAYYQLGRSRQALGYFKQAGDSLRLGLLAMKIGDYDAASMAFLEKSRSNPSFRTLFYLAWAKYTLGKYDDALTVLDKGISRRIKERAIGISLFIDQVEKVPVISEILENSPARSAGLLEDDMIIEINGVSTKGMDTKTFIQKISATKGDSVILKIKRHELKDELLQKKVVLDRVVDKTASEGFGLRSLILRHKGQLDKSFKDAEQAYSLNPANSWARLALGAAYLDHERYDNAMELFSQVEANTQARILQATVYAKKGNYQKAIDLYASIPEEKLSPQNIPLWSDRNALLEVLKPYATSKKENASRLRTQGRYKEALKELAEVMKIADGSELEALCREIAGMIAIDPGLSVIPEEARKHALRGDVLTEEGQFEDAVKEYQRAVQAAPYIPKLYFNTAMLYGELKKYSMAIRYMKTYLLLAPEAPNARAAKDQIYKWEFMMEKGK